MQKIKLAQLQSAHRLIYESIVAQLTSNNKRIHGRKRLNSLQNQHNTPLFRSQRRKTELQIERDSQRINREEFESNFSIDFKSKRWQTLQNEDKNRIKSQISEKRCSKNSEQYSQCTYSLRPMLRNGPLIYVKDMRHDQKERQQSKKKRKVQRFKSQKNHRIAKEELSNEQKQDLVVGPLKISIDLPKIKIKQSLIFKHPHLFLPFEKSRIEKSKIKILKKADFNHLSPWATKCQNVKQSDDILSL